MIRDAGSAVIRGWAVADLVVTAPLAVPPVATAFVKLLYLLNGHLGGVATSPPFDAVHLLFVCLAGGLGVVWAVARVLMPLRRLGTLDAVARLWVSALIAYFVLARGAPPVLLAFLATELGGALHQFWALRRPARAARW
jgi:hypothetical protein